jgi:hypothetical protein
MRDKTTGVKQLFELWVTVLGFLGSLFGILR